MKTWSKNYNDIVSDRSDIWQFWSRRNIYRFCFQNERRTVKNILETFSDISSILDYGCGEANSLNTLNVLVHRYDPFVEKYSNLPINKYDLVVCYNVMNVIEPEYIANVSEHIASCSNKYALFNIVCKDNKLLIGKCIKELTKYFDIVETSFTDIKTFHKIWNIESPKVCYDVAENRNFLYLFLQKKEA